MADIKKMTTDFLNSAKEIVTAKDHNVFKMLKNALIKPMHFYKNDAEGLNNYKKVTLFVGIIALANTILTLVIAVLKALLIGKTCVWGYCVETPLADRLSTINYWPITWQSFLYPILIALMLASIFYLGGLVANKKLNYPKLIGLMAVAVIPSLIINTVINPIIGGSFIQLGMILSTTALLYGIVIVIEFVKAEGNFKDKSDAFMYYFLACSLTVSTIIYLVVEKIFTSII